MCIAIVKPAGSELTRDTLYNCYLNNKDGCGFSYINTDVYGHKRIKIKKSMTFENFYTKYAKAVEDNPESTFLIHFRIATHGIVDEFNCHPFQINKEQAFIHNGIIPNMPNEGRLDQRSDTRIYKDRILRHLPRGWESNPAIKYMIEATIGVSKLAVLNIDNTFTIFKESSGHWKDNIWFSNTSYSYKPVYRTYYNSEYYKQDKTVTHLPAKTENKETRIFGLASKRAENELIECEWCSEYTTKGGAKRINMDGVDVICCDNCAAMLNKDELFGATTFVSLT